MANIDVPITEVTSDGVALATPVVTVTGNDYLIQDNDGNVLLQIVNATGTASWVDVIPTLEASGFELASHRITVPANKTTWAGPFPPFVFSSIVELNPDAAIALSLNGLRI